MKLVKHSSGDLSAISDCLPYLLLFLGLIIEKRSTNSINDCKLYLHENIASSLKQKKKKQALKNLTLISGGSETKGRGPIQKEIIISLGFSCIFMMISPVIPVKLIKDCDCDNAPLPAEDNYRVIDTPNNNS